MGDMLASKLAFIVAKRDRCPEVKLAYDAKEK